VARDVDVVVLGATGVTGRRVGAYLASRARETNSRWVAAGRDPDKVRRVLAQEGVDEVEVLAADIARPDSLKALAERARVVLNLVGPYEAMGREVVAACVEAGAHYADISGEMQFIRRVITEFDEAASVAGVKVVQPAGFESLPPDLLVGALAERAKERFQQPLAEVELEARVKFPPGLPRPTDGMSGGTSQTIIAALLDEDAAVAVDPAALTADSARAEHIRRLSPIKVRARRGNEGSVIAPMMPVAFINPAVIQRSAELSGDPPLRYREGTVLPGAGARRAPSLALAGILGGLQALQRSSVHASPAARRRYARGDARIRVRPATGPPRGLDVVDDRPRAHDRRPHRRGTRQRFGPRGVPRHRADDRGSRSAALRRRRNAVCGRLPAAIGGAGDGKPHSLCPRPAGVPTRLSDLAAATASHA
jgi:short subunit dehydrogenase-like uncharacterized protein